MCYGSANLLVRIGNMELNVHVGFTVDPGEKCVPYYSDGSGYPGSPPSIDSIDSVELNELEYMTGDIDSEDNWELTDLADRPGAKVIAERWAYDIIAGGLHDDELLESADFDEDWD